jgi:predicted outer membrane repeat protein
LIASRVHNNLTGQGGLAGASTNGDWGIPGERGSGGGLFAEDFAQVTLTGSTISENQAYHGGGIGVDESAAFNAMNATFSGNTADYAGGGLYVVNDGTIELTFSTVTGNIANIDFSGGGTGGGFYALAAFTTTNTIIAANLDFGSYGNADCHGYLYSGGYNVIGVVDSVNCIETLLPSDQSGTGAAPLNPLLAPLAYNGGPTKTHALGPASPAYDQILDGVNGCKSASIRDQRFIVRYANCDIGAYEYDLNTTHIYLPAVMR